MMRPTASEACAATPEGAAYLRDLEEWIDPAARTLAIRIEFGADARPTMICAREPTNPVRLKRIARRELGTRLAEPRTWRTGPACVANHGVELNRVAAKRAESDFLDRSCRTSAAETRRQLRGFAGRPGSIATREYQRCIDRKRDWVVARVFGHPERLVFGAVRDRADRIQSVDQLRRTCRGPSDLSTFLSCMSENGWSPVSDRDPDPRFIPQLTEAWPTTFVIELDVAFDRR